MIQRSPNQTRGPHALVLQLLRAGCRWTARTARSGSRARARGRRRTASWRRGRPAARRAPGRRSSAGRSPAGATCRCSCTLVQADSGASVEAYRLRRSTPWMSRCTSSPRAAKTMSFSAVYRGDGLIQSGRARCSVMSVGRMPIIDDVGAAPRRLVLGGVERGPQVVLEAERRVARSASAAARSSRCCRRRARSGRPGPRSPPGPPGCPGAAGVRASTRLSSTSSPVSGSSASLSNVADESMRSNTSRQSCTFSR